MLTVIEALTLSAEYLAKKNIESPRINAELLLAHTLSCRRLDLYLSYDRPLDQDEIKKYREFIRRRGAFEPLQYITGKVEFYGLGFKVSPSALIPRQETEIMIDAVIENVQAEKKLKILDIGTGSGIIAVTLAKQLVQAEVTAIDLSSEALALAYENAEMNSVGERIKFIQMDILENFNFDGSTFDIVVSNPPYISIKEFDNLRPELRIYEPKTSLTDFSDGFRFYKVILNNTGRILKKEGKVFFEVGEGQAEYVKRIMEANNFKVSVRKDYLNIERVIFGELL